VSVEGDGVGGVAPSPSGHLRLNEFSVRTILTHSSSLLGSQGAEYDFAFKTG